MRNPKDKKPTLISCHLRFNNDRIIFFTGERILPAEWDSSKQRAINRKKYLHNTEINIWLDKIDTEIKSAFRAFNLENVSPTPEVIKERIYDKLSPAPDEWESMLDCKAIVGKKGLYISENCSEEVRSAGEERFSEMYLGCIH